MACPCPERELLETEFRQAAKRWTNLEVQVSAAIRDADPDSNEYLAQAHRAMVAAKKAQKALDDHLIFHRCGSLAPKAAAATKD
jgi:hypothetical protein